MPIDVSPSVIATRQLSMIPFGSLIGSPLNAAIQAQAQAAMTSVNFINAVGLQRDEDGNAEAITVTFSYQDAASGITRNLVVPLLAIVPIPYIGIDDVSIDFKANISASSSSSNSVTTSQAFDASFKGKINYFFYSAEFNASYSSKKDSTATADSKYSVEYTMDVRVRASQSDMPQGLARVLNILETAVAERDPTGDLIVTPEGNSVNAVGDTIDTIMVVVNGQSKPIPGASIEVTSADTAVLSVSASPMTADAYGKGEVTLNCESLPNQPTNVDVTFKCDLSASGLGILEDVLRVRVG